MGGVEHRRAVAGGGRRAAEVDEVVGRRQPVEQLGEGDPHEIRERLGERREQGARVDRRKSWSVQRGANRTRGHLVVGRGGVNIHSTEREKYWLGTVAPNVSDRARPLNPLASPTLEGPGVTFRPHAGGPSAGPSPRRRGPRSASCTSAGEDPCTREAPVFQRSEDAETEYIAWHFIGGIL